MLSGLRIAADRDCCSPACAGLRGGAAGVDSVPPPLSPGFQPAVAGLHTLQLCHRFHLTLPCQLSLVLHLRESSDSAAEDREIIEMLLKQIF